MSSAADSVNAGRSVSQKRVSRPGQSSTKHYYFGAALVLLGLVLLIFVAPNLIDETRAFRLNKPPDPVQFEFKPPTFVGLAGAFYILVGFLTVLRDRLGSWTRFAAIAGVAFMPLLILAMALGRSDLSGTNVVNLLVSSLFLATPIALGSMTGLWSERVGIINIGIEGTMLGAAGIAYMTYALVGDGAERWALWLSVLVAILVGGLFALLLAVLSIRFGINQIIAGVVINLLALGLTGFLRSQVIVKSGVGTGVATPSFGIPLLSKIPVIGDQLFVGQPINFAMYLVVFLTWLVMFKTPWGLRVRACGEDPHAAETVGINVIRTRYMSVVLGGFIAGLAGAWFSLESSARFEDNMTNAAGFIALAAMIFGKWTPWGAFAGALLFGYADALQTRLQFLKVDIAGFEIPSEFWQMLPFAITILVVAGLVGRATPPAAEGKPFQASQ